MRFIPLAIAAIGLLSAPAIAHPEHDGPPMQRKSMGQYAKDAVIKLITQAKLDASWSKVEPLKSETRVRGGRQQWVVTFRNDPIKNANKRMLYVVLTQGGDYISSSLTPD